MIGMVGPKVSSVGQSHNANLIDCFPIWWGVAAAKPPPHPTKEISTGAFGPRTPTTLGRCDCPNTLVKALDIYDAACYTCSITHCVINTCRSLKHISRGAVMTDEVEVKVREVVEEGKEAGNSF